MTDDWTVRNQRVLTASVRRVRALLERQVARGEVAPDELEREPVPDVPHERDSALAAVCSAFGLSAFERDVVLMCAGVELEGPMASLCAAAHGEASRAHASFGLALAALPGAHWSALTPAAPLRRWRLVEVDGGSPTRDPLRITERVLHYLAGVDYLDEGLEPLLRPLDAPAMLPPSQADAVATVAAHIGAGSSRPRVQLHGVDPAERRALAAAACVAAGRRCWSLAAETIPAETDDQDALLRLWERETGLGAVVLVVDCTRLEANAGGGGAALERFVDRLSGPVIVAGRDPLAGLELSALRVEVGPPTSDERVVLWQRALRVRGADLNGEIDRLATQFQLDAAGIQSAVDEAVGAGGDAVAERLWDACRSQSRPKLEDMAERLEPAAGWVDLVLPADRTDALHEIAAHVRRRRLVYERWGFAEKSSRGLGIAALFSGPSGTGKTLAAEVLANELRLDLYRIDLSSVVSKYIGETEKNLRRVFDAAEGTGAILLFDEADALFGKRTDVKDSHDRYANIEVSYLLQRIEAYRGLAILTTNLSDAIDTAFMRRIRFVVRFPFPTHDQRRAIWTRTFPDAMPAEELQLDRLARLSIAGGNIRNIGLNAAFLAADAGEPVRMDHLLRAARSEYAKLEQPLTEVELGGWE